MPSTCPLILLLILVGALAHAQPLAAPVEDPAFARSVRLLLPPEISAVPGREINLYFDNIMCLPGGAAGWAALTNVDCPKGRQQSERWTWTPGPDDVGTYPLSVTFSGPGGHVPVTAQTTIRVVPADAGAGQTITALMIGDSLTHASIYPAEIVELMKQPGNPTLTLIGTHVPNPATPDVRHEGYGGWRASMFAGYWEKEPVVNGRRARSPFLYEKDGQPALDFQRYCDENNGGRGPDFITMLLGCNDNFGATDENIEASIEDFLRNMDILIAEFHRVRPDTRIGIVSLMPPAATQDAFGANYDCGQTRWQYKKNQHRVMERVVEKYGNREAENLFLVPAYVNLDTVNNYPKTTGPVNARNDTPTTRLCNGVHPDATGYRQMADSIYCWMKGQLGK